MDTMQLEQDSGSRSADVPPGHELVAEACPVCGNAHWTPLAQHSRVVFVSCSGCGVLYRRSFAGTADATGHAPEFDQPNNPRYQLRGGRRVQKSRHQILDLLNHCAPGPLLDVGCSVGHTLQAASGLGLSAAGVDVRRAAVDHCRALGFRAEIGTLEQLPFEPAEFQLVVLKHVLEHTPRPRAALREIRRVIRPGGGIFIAVPNGGYRRARKDPQHHKFFRGYSRFGHYVYYEPATLTRLLADTGFRTVQVHPHLVHRRSGLATRVMQLAIAPIRLAGQRILHASQLRKEFWLCALRVD